MQKEQLQSEQLLDEASLSSPSRDALVAWRAFFECGRALEDLLGAELDAAVGLSFRWYDVLVHLEEAGEGVQMTELARTILTSKSGLTRVIDQMEEQGLVARIRPGDNRRVVLVSITDEGVARLERGRRFHRDGIRRHFVEHLSADELKGLAASLEKVSQHVRPLRPGRIAG